MPNKVSPELSIVVPVYNESKTNLDALLGRLQSVLEPLISYEIIFVDDGSLESTASVLRELPRIHLNVRTVVLSRNFGEQAAICAGLKQARGEVTVNMDSDLQDPPELVPTMLQHWRDGCDVVYTQQIDRSDSFLRLLSTNAYYWLLHKFSKVAISHSGEFRLLSRRAVDALLAMPEKTVFLRYLVPFIGFKQVTIPFKRGQRTEGASSYSFIRLLRLGISGLIAASSFPLLFIPTAGLLLAFVGGGAYFIAGQGQMNMLPLLVWLSFLINMSSLVVIAIYISATLSEVRARPLYIVSEVITNASSKIQKSLNDQTTTAFDANRLDAAKIG